MTRHLLILRRWGLDRRTEILPNFVRSGGHMQAELSELSEVTHYALGSLHSVWEIISVRGGTLAECYYFDANSRT